jgi:hypothetical protein
MNCPPLLLRMTISRTEDHGYVVLWLPVFLAWIILAAIFIALSPLIILAALVAWPFGWARTVLLFIPLVCNCICNLHGLEVNVERKDRALFISFK